MPLWVAASIIALLVAAPALAQDDEIVDALVMDGYYLENRSDLVAQSVAAVVGGLADPELYLVELTESVDTLALADQLQREVGGTVLVVSPTEIGWASDRYDDATVEAAIDEAVRAFDTGPAEGLAAFADTLTPGDSGASSASGLAWLIPVGLIALVVGGVWLVMRRGRAERAASEQRRLDEAKRELDEQIAVVANYIVDLSDRVGTVDRPDVETLYRSASETFTGVQRDLPEADELGELASLSDRLDEARWELEAVEAALDGRPIPDRPIDRPAACFFDPNHGAGTEEAVLETPAGSRTVAVCRQCKARLARGEQVQPRDINVGGRPVPAPQAPRTHGGLGFDWLDAFQILVGGSTIGYDLGRPPRPARRGKRVPAPSPGTSRRPRIPSPSTSRGRTGSRGTRSRGRRTRSRSGTRSRGSRRR